MNNLDYVSACVDAYKMKQKQYKYKKSCESIFNDKQRDLRIYKVFDGKQFYSVSMKILKINDLIQIYEYLDWSNKSTLYKDKNGYSYFKVIKEPYIKKFKVGNEIVGTMYMNGEIVGRKIVSNRYIDDYVDNDGIVIKEYIDLEELNEEEAIKYMQKYKSNSKYQYTGMKLKGE